jgi:hypothetical protein
MRALRTGQPTLHVSKVEGRLVREEDKVPFPIANQIGSSMEDEIDEKDTSGQQAAHQEARLGAKGRQQQRRIRCALDLSCSSFTAA